MTCVVGVFKRTKMKNEKEDFPRLASMDLAINGLKDKSII